MTKDIAEQQAERGRKLDEACEKAKHMVVSNAKQKLDNATKKAAEGEKRVSERMAEMTRKNALAGEERHLRRLARQQAAERQARAKEFERLEFEERVAAQAEMIANRNKAQAELREMRSKASQQFDIERKKVRHNLGRPPGSFRATTTDKIACDCR